MTHHIDTMSTSVPQVALRALDNLWLQVGGTVCNLWCTHCFISCSPDNHAYGFMTLEQVRPHLEASKRLGVKEYYFTGGEPFMNREIVDILAATLAIGPATVLTNGTVFREEDVQRLAGIERASPYSLEFRVSIDGYSPETNDPVRGEGTFRRAMEGVQLLLRYGFLPIITAARVWDESEDAFVQQRFVEALKAAGYDRPRLKVLPSLRLGREVARSRGYAEYERVTPEMMSGYDEGHLLCSNSRIVTDRGVHVCPILIDFPEARLGATLEEAMTPYPLRHRACYTCYLYGAICSNASSLPEK